MNLSPHFTLAEFVRSQYAARHGIDNTPTPDVIDNLRLVALNLEVARYWLSRAAGRDVPITITSGYRCWQLNDGVGGSILSAHLSGQAADFTTARYSPARVIDLIRDRMSFDQLINEFGEWVHLGFNLGVYRNQVLTIT